MTEAPSIRVEVMSPTMTKFHVLGLGFDLVLHRFTGPDEGDPHDHPFSFEAHVLRGMYVEERFAPEGALSLWTRDQSDCPRIVQARDIHRITHVVGPECWTAILPGPKVRESYFWNFDGPTPRSRHWSEPDFPPSANEAEGVGAAIHEEPQA